jgi:putative DNA primase/helicase
MLAQAEPYLTVEIDDFDRDPLTVNCRNGTLHLKLGAGGLEVESRPHDPADRITRFVDVAYDATARAPHFLATVNASLPDADVRGFFQRGLGYSSTGQTHEQAMFICQGLGRDGKSTLLDAVRETLGGYGAVGKVETFLDIGQRGGGDAAPDIVKLAGDVRWPCCRSRREALSWPKGCSRPGRPARRSRRGSYGRSRSTFDRSPSSGWSATPCPWLRATTTDCGGVFM